MSRVSENSSTASLQYAIGKAKQKMENLQIKGTTLKRITKPSDDPMSNFQSLQLKSVSKDNQQYLRNINYALSQLNTTEKTLEQLTDILVKAKDISIQQASDFYDNDIRRNVSHEIIQLRNHSLALANKRLGNRYIFGGLKTLKEPFNQNGDYFGDQGHIQLEITKDYFIPISLSGSEVFFSSENISYPTNPLKDIQELPQEHLREDEKTNETNNIRRELASIEESESKSESNVKDDDFSKKDNIFSQLTGLITSLENNDTVVIQDLLERIDTSVSRMITMRTRIGSLVNTALKIQQQLEVEMVENETYQSKLSDADVATLFSDITKQQNVLHTAYQTGGALINKSLIDFIQ